MVITYITIQPLPGGSGNRAGLVCARISSYVNTYKGEDKLGLRLNPWTYYTSPDQESRAALLLLLTSIPYFGLYISVSHAFATFALKPLKLNVIFLCGYVCVVFVQVCFLVYVAQIVVYSLNYFQIDPDMHAIPMVTALGDLLGTLLLLSLFYILSFGDEIVYVNICFLIWCGQRIN